MGHRGATSLLQWQPRLGAVECLDLGLFVEAEDDGILASLVNTAKLNGVDPEAWLGDALERIVSGEVTVNRQEELLPWRWKAERQASSAWISHEVAA